MDKKTKKKETIIVFSAHSDDFVLGAGGTILEYAKQGRNVTAVIFSYGEKSHPWIKEDIIRRVRSQESIEAGQILQCSIIFFDLREGKFLEDYDQKKMEKELISLIKKEKPSKVFTHSHEDPHPDHRAVHTISLNLFKQIPESKKPELYMYSIWNPVSLKTKYPSLYIDISQTFMAKMKALRVFRSQRIHVAYPIFLSLFRDLWEGLKIKSRFAEKFFRIK